MYDGENMAGVEFTPVQGYNMIMTTSGTTCDRKDCTIDMEMEGGSSNNRDGVAADYGCTGIVERMNIGGEATNTFDYDKQNGLSGVCSSTTEIGDGVAADNCCTVDRGKQHYFSHGKVAGGDQKVILEAKNGL
jgi:hypothetical protein